MPSYESKSNSGMARLNLENRSLLKTKFEYIKERCDVQYKIYHGDDRNKNT